MSDTPQQPAGWYYAQGDPPGTQRYWSGEVWEGEPQPVPGAPQEVVGGPVTAEAINRIGARLIDGVLWFFAVLVVQGVIAGTSLFDSNADVSYGRIALAGIAGTLVIAGYEIFFVGTRGATPGKMALGLKVVRADGSDVDMNDAVRRMAHYLALGILGAIAGPLGFLFSIALFVITIVSLIFLFTDAMKQTVWDKIANTIVVSSK